MTDPPKPDDPSSPSPHIFGASLDEVWQRYGEQLRRRARTRLRQYGLSGQAESMDICNDVMADLMRQRQRLDDGKDQPGTPHDQPVDAEQMMGYILRAIDNQVLDTFRTLARQCRDFRRVSTSPIEELRFVNQSPTPSQLAIRDEVLQRVRSLLGSDEARAVDLMLENRSWKEIGDAMGIEPDTARMKVRRALERVRDRMGIASID